MIRSTWVGSDGRRADVSCDVPADARFDYDATIRFWTATVEGWSQPAPVETIIVEGRTVTAPGFTADQLIAFVVRAKAAQLRTHPVNPGNVARSFDAIVKAAGLRRIRPHDLRHTSATLLLLAGTLAKVVSERLGHASIGITLDLYSHVLPSMQDDAASAMGALFDRAALMS